MREEINRQVVPVVLDLAALALAGVAEVIAARREMAEQGDGHGNGWLRGSLEAWMASGDWDRQGLREAGALIAAEIDGLGPAPAPENRVTVKLTHSGDDDSIHAGTRADCPACDSGGE